MRTMYDAAYPPTSPPQTDAVAGYIGGNTPHVWSVAEWDSQVVKSGATFKLPIFTRSHDGDPALDSAYCISWLKAHSVPPGVLLALDYETRVDAAYLTAFDGKIVAAGWKTIVYGSLSTIMQNPKPSGGYWTAKWNNIPHIDPGAAITQYGGDVTLGQPYDLNLVTDGAVLWSTEEDMVYTQAQLETFAYNGAKKALNEGTGAGQLSWAATSKATLANVQSIINYLNDIKMGLGANTDAILAAIAALPTYQLTDADKTAIATQVVALVPALQVEDVLKALGAKLTAG